MTAGDVIWCSVYCVLIGLAVAIVFLPFCVLWSWLHKRSFREGIDNAGKVGGLVSEFAFLGCMMLVLCIGTLGLVLPLIAIVGCLCFFTFDWFGVLIVGQKHYWPIIGPGMTVCFLLLATWLWRSLRKP